MLLYVNQIKFGTKRSEVRIFSPRPDLARVFGIIENPSFFAVTPYLLLRNQSFSQGDRNHSCHLWCDNSWQATRDNNPLVAWLNAVYWVERPLFTAPIVYQIPEILLSISVKDVMYRAVTPYSAIRTGDFSRASITLLYYRPNRPAYDEAQEQTPEATFTLGLRLTFVCV